MNYISLVYTLFLIFFTILTVMRLYTSMCHVATQDRSHEKCCDCCKEYQLLISAVIILSAADKLYGPISSFMC